MSEYCAWTLRPSRLLTLAVVLIGLLALLSFAGLELPWPLRAAGGVAVLVMLARALWAVWGPHAIASLNMQADGSFETATARGVRGTCTLVGPPKVSGPLVVIRLRGAGGAVRSIALLHDAMTPAAWRGLRVALQWRLPRLNKSDLPPPEH